MIKIIANAFRPQMGLFTGGRWPFCTSKVEKKASDINAMFTDKGVEQSKDKKITSGRSWKAQELRLKSTDDLHKLWFVCVREKNIVLADELALQFDPTYRRKAGKIRRVQKLQQTMRRILFVIQERENLKKEYRKQLEEEYIQKKKAELQAVVAKQPEPFPQITHEMLRAKYHNLRKGIDNIEYLENIFAKKQSNQDRNKRAEERVAKLDPEKEFESFWQYEMTIGERPTQMQILKSHVKNWKSLNLKQRKIILGFLNARRAKDARAQFKKQLKILGQKIAFEEAKSRYQQKSIPQ